MFALSVGVNVIVTVVVPALAPVYLNTLDVASVVVLPWSIVNISLGLVDISHFPVMLGELDAVKDAWLPFTRSPGGVAVIDVARLSTVTVQVKPDELFTLFPVDR